MGNAYQRVSHVTMNASLQGFKCGDECIDKYRARKERDCDGKCIKESELCNNECIPGWEKCGNKCIKSYNDPYARDCNGECLGKNFPCNGTCLGKAHLCGDYCVEKESDMKDCDGQCMDDKHLRNIGYNGYNGNVYLRPMCGSECFYGFKCADGSGCLATGAECDGTKHCPDGSDEDPSFCQKCHKYELNWGRKACKENDDQRKLTYCATQPCNGRCTKGYWRCGDKCIRNHEYCDHQVDGGDDDGDDDDEDGDEDGDEEGYMGQRCSAGRFDCGDKSCIKDKVLCDGVKDCKNGSDEENCPDCSKRHGTWVCGGKPQCRDTRCGVGKSTRW